MVDYAPGKHPELFVKDEGDHLKFGVKPNIVFKGQEKQYIWSLEINIYRKKKDKIRFSPKPLSIRPKKVREGKKIIIEPIADLDEWIEIPLITKERVPKLKGNERIHVRLKITPVKCILCGGKYRFPIKIKAATRSNTVKIHID